MIRRTLREYIKRKEPKAFIIGRTYHVFERALCDFIKGNAVYVWRKKGTYPFVE